MKKTNKKKTNKKIVTVEELRPLDRLENKNHNIKNLYKLMITDSSTILEVLNNIPEQNIDAALSEIAKKTNVFSIADVLIPCDAVWIADLFEEETDNLNDHVVLFNDCSYSQHDLLRDNDPIAYNEALFTFTDFYSQNWHPLYTVVITDKKSVHYKIIDVLLLLDAYGIVINLVDIGECKNAV